MNNKVKTTTEEKINRKDALKKAGRYAAFTAAASIVLLTPLKAQEQPTSMGSGYGGGGPVGPPGSGNSFGRERTPWDPPKPAAPPSSGTLKKSPWEK